MTPLAAFCLVAVVVLGAAAWAFHRATRPGPTLPVTCDEARALAARLHESAAWHCGCEACRSWRRAMRGRP